VIDWYYDLIMAITIKDIAKRVGVAPSTVSRALNGRGRMSSVTREKIRQVAQELGYYPNMLAKGLTTRKAGSVGVVIDRRHIPVERSFYSPIIEAIESTATPHGYHVIFATLKNHSSLKIVKERKVDGVVLIGTDISDELASSLLEEIPIVLVDNHLQGVDSIAVDNFGGAYRAVEYLIELGHRKIGFVTETMRDLSFRERFAGYQEALKKYGIKLDEQLIAEGGRRRGSGSIALEKLFEGKTLPTAIFVANDYTAVEVIWAIKAAGLNVPEDISVVGFDDNDIARIVDPLLTTVHVPRKRMGEEAFRRLLALIGDPTLSPTKIVFPTELVIRDSSGYKARSTS